MDGAKERWRDRWFDGLGGFGWMDRDGGERYGRLNGWFDGWMEGYFDAGKGGKRREGSMR